MLRIKFFVWVTLGIPITKTPRLNLVTVTLQSRVGVLTIVSILLFSRITYTGKFEVIRPCVLINLLPQVYISSKCFLYSLFLNYGYGFICIFFASEKWSFNYQYLQ